MSDTPHKIQEKPSRSRAPRRGPAPASGSSPARLRAAAILEVLAGVRRPSEAAQALGTSLPRYYQLEQRALAGLLRACEPSARGPRLDPTRQLAKLERENQRLQRECDRQQALVRMAERSLGLPATAAVKSPAKGQPQGASKNGSKPRRKRRPSVRALQVVRGLRSNEASETTTPAGPVSGVAVRN
jgi:hypothetical protein